MAAQDKALYDTLEATARAFISSTDDAVATKDPNKVLTTLSPDCRRHIHPASFLRALGFPTDVGLSNEAHLAEMAKYLPRLKLFKPTVVHSAVVDVRKRAVVLYVTSCIREEKEQEFVFMLDMNEAGDKVAKVVQFVDSAEMLDFRNQ